MHMHKGRNRNQPCWCGSGIKYKKCHLNREIQTRDNPWEALERNRKAFSRKLCLAKDKGFGTCEGSIVKAHSISRGHNLAKIAEEGHVLTFKVEPSNAREEAALALHRVGIKTASIFTGFCAKHDRDLFSCIELEEFVGRPDQCLAIAFRTVSRELYGKDAMTHLKETLRSADKGMPVEQQLMFQRYLSVIDQGMQAALREIAATHRALATAFASGDSHKLRTVIFEFAAPLPFMVAGAWSPFTDLYSRRLQSGYVDELLQQVIIASFACATGGVICVSWLAEDNAPGMRIAEQVCDLPASAQATALLQLATKHVENVFFRPSWFAALGEEQKDALQRLFASGVDSSGSIPSVPINFSLAFPLPEVVGVRRV